MTGDLIKRRNRNIVVQRENEATKTAKKDRVNIGVSVDSHLWRRLRALAITKGTLTGDLLDRAIEIYLEKYEK